MTLNAIEHGQVIVMSQQVTGNQSHVRLWDHRGQVWRSRAWTMNIIPFGIDGRIWHDHGVFACYLPSKNLIMRIAEALFLVAQISTDKTIDIYLQ